MNKAASHVDQLKVECQQREVSRRARGLLDEIERSLPTREGYQAPSARFSEAIAEPPMLALLRANDARQDGAEAAYKNAWDARKKRVTRAAAIERTRPLVLAALREGPADMATVRERLTETGHIAAVATAVAAVEELVSSGELRVRQKRRARADGARSVYELVKGAQVRE
jgi:hypothetical protein